jgi:putative ABC transport system substrate-binding protein
MTILRLTRREFVAVLGCAAAWPMVARGQISGKRPLVAFLSIQAGATTAAPFISAFSQAMEDLGWVEGGNYDTVHRYSGGDTALMPMLAEQLVLLEPSVIVSSSVPVVALKRATTTIPIVGATLKDPIGLGLATSYVRPGGNVTGILLLVDELQAKQFELATEMVPGIRTIGTLQGADANAVPEQRDSEAVATARLKIETRPLVVNRPEELEKAFETFSRENVQAVVIFSDALLFVHRQRLAELARLRKLPTIFSSRENVDAGGLISYGVDIRNNYRLAAALVDKILRGAKPSDLPIEVPTKLEMIINLKTAKAIDLAIPPNLLARADEVIE